MKNYKLFLIIVLGLMLAIQSCTDLKEVILDETAGPSLSPRESADAVLAPAYARLNRIYLHTNYFALQQITSDESILPYRGGTDWGDNGIYVALHSHTFDANTANVRNTWNEIFQALSRAVTAVNELPNINDPIAATYLAEARALRAFYSWMTLDLYNVVFVKENINDNSVVLRGAEAFEYIKSELEAAEPLLADNVGPGRITKAAAQALLARLYLNAAVYKDRYADAFKFDAADLTKVIENCDKIINSGKYRLSAEYFDIFSNNNHTNPELIFAIDQRPDLNGHNRMAYFSLSGEQHPVPAAYGANGTDGPAITADFYQTWAKAYAPLDPADADARFFQRNLPQGVTCVDGATYRIDRGILRGQQYGLAITQQGYERCEDGKFKIIPLDSRRRGRFDLPVIHTEAVDFTTAGSNYPTGYRVHKYEFSQTTTDGRNRGEHDIIVMRLADVYLMRAEAKLRRDNDAASALADVNTVRKSRTARQPIPPALTEMNLDLLFRERGFELYWEHLRRTDMIRFGKFEGTWVEKTSTNKFRRVFPIPQSAIDGASNVPGYLTQNEGY